MMTEQYENEYNGALYANDDDTWSGRITIEGVKYHAAIERDAQRPYLVIRPITRKGPGKRVKLKLRIQRRNNRSGPIGVMAHRAHPLCIWKAGTDQDTGYYYLQIRPDRKPSAIPRSDPF
jgi:hypothetical protein